MFDYMRNMRHRAILQTYCETAGIDESELTFDEEDFVQRDEEGYDEADEE